MSKETEEILEENICPCCGENIFKCFCYSGCSDPEYHNGEPCDLSC